MSLPGRAGVVVIGGGVGGASVAYHLALLGERDVVLLERDELTSGSTFHSAGLVGQLRADPTLTAMNRYSVELYRALQASEHPPGWVECGSIRLASSVERWEEIRRQLGWAASSGLELHALTPAQAVELFPLMSPAGVHGAAFMPTDGQVDPAALCYSLVAQARALGVAVHTRTRVVGIDTAGADDRMRVTRVRTDRGDVECEVVVDCGGMFAAELARLVGVRVPIVPMSHQYVVTEAMFEHRATPLPSLRDPDLLVYYRQEVDGLVMGGYERRSAPWTANPHSYDAIPADFNGRLLPEDWSRFEEIADNARIRVPEMESVGIRRFVNGPEGFTPDNEFCLAAQHGKSLTFMAKFNEREGNSCHIHLSVRDGDGGMVMASDGDADGLSPLGRAFVAGQLAHLRELSLFYAPNINSYKRFARGSFAPTAVKWGRDNRTCAVRLVGHGPSLRLENRVPGGDVNPYLAMAGMVAAGLDGIERDLPLEDAFAGNAYEVDAEHVPDGLADALALWERSEWVRSTFGPEVHDHYTNMGRVELDAFGRAVTDWERHRGFERL